MEAASKRINKPLASNTLNFNRINPLSFEEIEYALRIILVKQGDKWNEHYRPYRHIWMLFLEKIESTKLIRKSLPEMNIREIPEITSNSNFPLKNSIGNITKVENFPAISFQKSYHPEANLIVNNTKYIKEIVYDRNNPEELILTPFEKIINKEFHYEENASSVGFDTKLYYEEALKLSHTPEKCAKTHQNPILTYVPEKLASEKCKFVFFEEKNKNKNGFFFK